MKHAYEEARKLDERLRVVKRRNNPKHIQQPKQERHAR